MGKLLQKLANKIAPSWLTKIKSSAVDTLPKTLALPYFDGSTQGVSSPSPSSSTTHHNTEAPWPLVAYDSPDQSKDDDDDDDDDARCAKACSENSDAWMSPSLIEERISKLKMHKSTQNHDHQHQDHIDPHQPQHVDVKISNNGIHRRCNTESCTNSETPSSSKKKAAATINTDKHDYHPQHQQKDHKNQPGLKKRNQSRPEEDNQHHREGRRGNGCRAVERRELCDFLDLDRQGNVRRVREDHPHIHYDHNHSHSEAEIEEEHYRNLYHDLIGLKRKSQYLQEEEQEEGEEESDGEGSSRSGNMSSRGWEQKRRKEEIGITSCELPESICGIVGNGRAVVKHSQDPQMAMWESMVEMIVGNGLWDEGSLEFLLFCYLSLNESHLHPIILSSFFQVLQDLQKV